MASFRSSAPASVGVGRPGRRVRRFTTATVALLATAALVGCSADESASPAMTATSDGSGAVASVVVYRTPTCGCCEDYEDYLREHGYTVQSEVRDDLQPIRAEHKVPGDAASCHTVSIGGYAVEGHVPIEAIDMLLAERPTIDGIGIPGMPTNAPGMGEPDGRPLEVLSFSDGNVQPFVTL